MIENTEPPQFTGTVILEIEKFDQGYICYEHTLANGVPLYYGISRAIDVFRFNDARVNSEWQKYALPGIPFSVKLLYASEHEFECFNFRAKLMRERPAWCNVHGKLLDKLPTILCEQTNETFRTISDAARAKCISQPALSNHLNRREGYRRVKGLTFRRILPSEAMGNIKS